VKLKTMGTVAVVVWCTAVCVVFAAYARSYSQNTHPGAKATTMTNHASGPFDVKATPQKPDNPAAVASGLGRMSLDKQYHGDLEATGQGEMLAIRPDAKGSGVYVAIERVTGTLKGRSGSFVLHHTGIMNRGTPQLTIEVAPDSGTGELAGISGKMNIVIGEGGKHTYEFEYTLPQ
jgi:Protein of unknown function (DUF3224)